MQEAAKFKAGVVTIAFGVMFACYMLYMLVSCTLSFQNISTHGTAQDLVDENLKTDPTTSPNLEIPLK